MPMKGESCRPEHGESNAGRNILGTIWDAASIVLSLWNLMQAKDLADKQLTLANRYLQLERNWREHFNAHFKPLEDQTLAEAWAEQLHPAHYDAAIGRALAGGRLAFKGRLEKGFRCTSQYATGLRRARLKDELTSQAAGLAALAGLGLRNEQAHVEAMNDRRWKHRESIVNQGRDMMADSVKYAQLAAGIYGDLSAQASAGAGSLFALGYSQNRRETQYPGYLQVRTTYRQPTTAEAPETLRA